MARERAAALGRVPAERGVQRRRLEILEFGRRAGPRRLADARLEAQECVAAARQRASTSDLRGHVVDVGVATGARDDDRVGEIDPRSLASVRSCRSEGVATRDARIWPAPERRSPRQRAPGPSIPCRILIAPALARTGRSRSVLVVFGDQAIEKPDAPARAPGRLISVAGEPIATPATSRCAHGVSLTNR